MIRAASEPSVVAALSEVVPVSVVMLCSLAAVVWLAARIISLFDHYLNGAPKAPRWWPRPPRHTDEEEPPHDGG